MECNCPENYTNVGEECIKITTIENIVCPPDCSTIIQEDGNAICECFDSVEPIISDVPVPISLTDPEYFEDVSWTVAYSPIHQSWMSFYDFKPNYYINHSDYFQTGINQTNDPTELGLWGHLLTNKSYQVFYGKRYPWLIEYQLKRSGNNLYLNSVEYQADALRYHNEYDYSVADSTIFNKMWIHSMHTNSGQLNLIKNTGVLSQISNYPKTASDGSYQEILVSKNHEAYTVNYFYNRIVKSFTNVTPWIWDKNQIEKEINNNVIKFGGKNILEPLRTRVPTVRLSQDAESRFRYIFNLGVSKIKEES